MQGDDTLDYESIWINTRGNIVFGHKKEPESVRLFLLKSFIGFSFLFLIIKI